MGSAVITERFDEIGDAVESELWVDWRKAKAEMLRTFPMLRSGGGIAPPNEWEAIIENIFAWSLAMFRAGVQRGAIMEFPPEDYP